MMPTTVRLTEAELTVIGQHIGETFELVAGQPIDDGDSLLSEGIRSLVARGLCRIDGDGPLLSSELVAAVGPLARPDNVIALSRAGGGVATVGVAAAMGDRFVAYRSLMEGVHEFRWLDRADLVKAILAGMFSDKAMRPEVWQIRAISRGGIMLLSIGIGADGSITALNENGTVDARLDKAQLAQRLDGLLATNDLPA